MAETTSVTLLSPSHPPSSGASDSVSDSRDAKTQEAPTTTTTADTSTTATSTTAASTTDTSTSTETTTIPSIGTPTTASTTLTPPTPTSTTPVSPVLPSPASSARRIVGGPPAKKTPLTNALQKGRGGRQSSVGSLRGPSKIKTTTPKTAKKRALLVDDITVTAHLVVNGLHRAGYEADTAKDGRAAVDSAKKHQYDVILMDVKLPLMDGVEATRLIRQHEKENDLPPCLIFGLTAATAADELKSYEDAGMDGCIEKGCVVPVAVAYAVATKKADPSQKFIFIDPKTEITQEVSSSKMRTASTLASEATPATTGTSDVVDKE